MLLEASRKPGLAGRVSLNFAPSPENIFEKSTKTTRCSPWRWLTKLAAGNPDIDAAPVWPKKNPDSDGLTQACRKDTEQYGAQALRRAIAEALERATPRSSSVAFLLRRQPRFTPLALDLSRHPEAQSLDVRPHDLETYDELAQNKNSDE